MVSSDDEAVNPGQPSSKVANQERLIALGNAVDGRTQTVRASHRKPRSRRYKWIRRSIITVGLVIVLIVGGVVADYYYLGSLVHHKPVKQSADGRAGGEREHPADRIDQSMRAQGAEPGVRSVLPGGHRYQQRHRHDHPSRSDHRCRVAAVHSARPVRAQRSRHWRQQNRRGARRGAESARRRD